MNRSLTSFLLSAVLSLAFGIIVPVVTPEIALASCGSLPNVFTNNVDTVDAATTNANNNFLLNCAKSVDNTQIGAAGIYASQIVPVSGATATFGGSFGYTISLAAPAQVPLTVLAAAAQTGDLVDVCGTTCGTKFFGINASGNIYGFNGQAFRSTPGNAQNANGDTVVGLSSAANNYAGCTGTAQTCTWFFYTNGTGSAFTASINSAGAIFSKALAANQCVGSNASSVLATTGAACGTVTNVTASSPLASSGGATPNLTCPGCALVYGSGGAEAATPRIVADVTPLYTLASNCVAGALCTFSGAVSSETVTFPITFAAAPRCTVGAYNLSGLPLAQPTVFTITTTQLTVEFFNVSASTIASGNTIQGAYTCTGHA